MSNSKETKAPPEMVSEDWSKLPWRKLEQHVYRLQKRIYQASCRGNEVAVRRLQQLLMRSSSAHLLATRRVTQDNQGKKTAGVDGKAALTPTERLVVAQRINPKNKLPKPRPVRRIWIPKPGKTEKRPLGIPTMEDRARQALAKLALEPEWEAKFEPNSYGFRPGRSSHDAIEAIFQNVSKKSKYVLDADIRGCFDHIDHAALLGKLATYPAMSRLIKGWLKAGVMEAGNLTPSEEGTPQGGVISPLLANIALHGLETEVQNTCTTKEGRSILKAVLVRYADDFVVIHPTLAGVEKAKRVVEEWLKGIGLELKPEKTRIVQTLEGKDAGFDFLGFNVRQYATGAARSGRANDGKPLGFKTLIKPSKEAIKQHAKELKRVVRSHQAAPQGAVIARLNPIITGWANYYRTVIAGEAFSRQGHQLYCVMRAWARRRHPNKSLAWVSRKYWEWEGQGGWTFTDGKHALNKHSDVHIIRHTKVQGKASPFNGDLLYWGQRLKDHPMLGTRTGKLLVLQKGRCAYCGLQFRSEDQIETDHIIPRQLGGDDKMENLQLLHRHCHDQKTAKYDAEMAKIRREVSMTKTILLRSRVH